MINVYKSSVGYGVINSYASDAAFVSATGITPKKGDFYFNNTSNIYRFYNGTSWETLGATSPGSSTDNAIVRFDGVSGNILQNSDVLIDDTNNILWGSDGGGDVGALAGNRPYRLYLKGRLFVGDNTLNTSLDVIGNDGLAFFGNNNDVASYLGSATGDTFARIGFFKSDSSDVGFYNNDLVSDEDIYVKNKTVDTFKFGGDGSFNLLGSVPIILWDIDGTGGIGSPTDNRPSYINLSSSLTIGSNNYKITQATVDTIDATVTMLQNISVSSNTSMLIEARVTAGRTGGLAGSVGDSAYYILRVRAKNIAGVVTLYDQLSEESEDQAGWDVQFVVSGAFAQLQVTGAIDNDITWKTTTITQLA